MISKLKQIFAFIIYGKKLHSQTSHMLSIIGAIYESYKVNIKLTMDFFRLWWNGSEHMSKWDGGGNEIELFIFE